MARPLPIGSSRRLALIVTSFEPPFTRMAMLPRPLLGCLRTEFSIRARWTPTRSIPAPFDSLSERRVGALLLGADAFYGGRVEQIVSLAARHKMPAIYYRREFAEAGGLASYGASVVDSYRQTGVYVARVL